MRLAAEGMPDVDGPSVKQISKLIRRLRSFGPISFASLTADDGSYVQVAGGGVACMVEWHDASRSKQLRAFQDPPVSNFPDGTRLVFSGGEIPLMRDEWFHASQVIEVFLAFAEGRIEGACRWREVELR